MNTSPELQRTLADYVEGRQDRLVEITRELIRIPSENIPPQGSEKACQTWIAQKLTACGLQPDLYSLSEVSGLAAHPLYFPGRTYTDRPNLGARRKGSGGGRSLLLSGHIDTVPRGTQDWTRDPFGGEVEANRIFGRGSNDMKAGVAINLFITECVTELALPLSGDLLFETVVDEEFGGSNGTLAGRLRGYNADAAILGEPSSLRICPAQRGGRTAHITFRAGTGGILQNGRFPAGITPQLTRFLCHLPTFASRRNAGVRVHEMYADHTDPVPVSVMKIFTSPWGYGEPMTVPETAQVELYWQLMPGESQDDVEREFFDWLNELVGSAPEIYPVMPEVTFPLRWLPGSSISGSEPLIQKLAECAETVLGVPPIVAGIEGPCDLFIFHQGFGIPAALWGPKGGNTHAADEYVEIDSMVSAAKTLLLFVAEWCGAC
jgi:acetylornithine deacetylase